MAPVPDEVHASPRVVMRPWRFKLLLQEILPPNIRQKSKSSLGKFFQVMGSFLMLFSPNFVPIWSLLRFWRNLAMAAR
ncbi:MAG: hypothetical protein F4Z20_02165 [Gammaproteobacteria bacterium]|nr:hypothetical protein [Gammaproteobacteria bacterium]